MKINTIRFDLSDRLIHFFRRINLEGINAPLFPEHMGFGNVYEDTKFSALFMLRCAIRQRRLWATWSYRKGVRTIYGPSPAVCFTEMPIAAFLEAGEQRERRGEAMSQFALIFPKQQMFKRGANPVIYGFDDRRASLPPGKDGKARIMSESLLPAREQYRYVTYNPGSVDWSHEREWRWPYSGSMEEVEKQLEEFGIVSTAEDMPGLEFPGDDLQDLGVVVRTREQAQWIIHDILSLIDRKVIGRSQYSFILCAKDLPHHSDLRDTQAISDVICREMIDLEPYFRYDSNELESLSKRFSEIVSELENLNPEVEEGELGGCWLWLLDNTHKLTRALIHTGRVTVSNDRRYLAFPYEFSNSRSLRQRETMTKQLSERIKAEFNIECGYFSVLNSDNPDDVPFYCDDHLDNNMFYNIAWVDE